MSQRRQQRRAKQVRRTNVRAAQRRRQPPTPAQLAARVIREYREPLETGDPLDAELVASMLIAPGWEQQMLSIAPQTQAEVDAMPHPVMPLIALLRSLDPATLEAEDLADPALALAHALAATGTDDPQVVAASGVLLEHLRGAGATDPAWAGEIGAYELASAVNVRDVWMDHHQLVLTFRDAAGREHGIVVVLAGNRYMEVEDLDLIEDPAGAVAQMRETVAEHEDGAMMRVEELSAVRVGGMLWAAVETMLNDPDEPLSEEQFELWQLLLSRYELLEPAAKADTEAASATPFDSVIDGDGEQGASVAQLRELFEQRGGRADVPDVTDEQVELVLEWVHQFAHPRALFGPHQVWQLIDHLTRELDARGIDPTQEYLMQLISMTRAWARFCAELVGLDQAALDDVLGATEHYGEMLIQSGR